MLIVGITGGIGSGKTIVSKIFSVLEIPVYYADTEAKKILYLPELREKLLKIFSKDILDQRGEPDRKKISAIVFNDKEKLEQLNALIHPAVVTAFENWKQKQNAPYILKEAAILFESGTYKGCDKIVTVVSPRDLKIKRIIARDNFTEEEVLKRMNNQMNDEEKIKRSDFVIYNDEKQLLIPQVLKIHEELINFIK